MPATIVTYQEQRGISDQDGVTLAERKVQGAAWGTAVEGGGSQPITLGPFTSLHTDGESDRVALPDGIIGLISPVSITVTAIDFDGDLSQGLSLDVQTFWAETGDCIGVPGPGNISPLAFTTEEAPLTKTGVQPGFSGHYANMLWNWNGAGGPNSHATFYATFEVK